MNIKDQLISGRKYLITERLSIRHAFVAAIVAGVFCIILGIWFNSSVMSMILPLLVMGGYIYYVLNDEPDLPKSTIGDSFYYLGFILTLSSLVVSLVALAGSDGVNMNAIIGSFGAALTTTIVGLIARLFVTSFSVESRVRRERLEDEMERTITQFTLQLGVLTSQVNASITSVHSNTNEAIESTLAKYQSVSSEVATGFKETMDDCSEKIQVSFHGLSTRIDAVEVKPDLITQPVGAALSKLIETIEVHSGSYYSLNESMVASNNKFSNQLDKSSSVMSDHINTLESRLAHVVDEQSKAYQVSLEGITRSIYDSLGEIKDIKLDAHSSASLELSSLAGNVSAFNGTLKEWHANLQSALEGFEGITILTKTNAEHMEKGALQLESAASKINEGLSETSNVRSAMKKSVEHIGDLNIQLVEAVEVGKSTNAKMHVAANLAEDASEKVSGDIADIYDSLNEQLEQLREPI